jgi:hypothetical protein
VSLQYGLHRYLKNRTSLAVGLYTVNPSNTSTLLNCSYSPIFYEIRRIYITNIEQLTLRNMTVIYFWGLPETHFYRRTADTMNAQVGGARCYDYTVWR